MKIPIDLSNSPIIDNFHSLEVSKLLLALNRRPKWNMIHGTGISSSETNAKKVPAQCMPQAWYTWIVKSGNTAPNK